MNVEEDIEEALLKARERISGGTGCPQDIFHPDFGWVLINGRPTENTPDFLKWLKSFHTGR